jgi:hypothetical protein
MVANNLTSPSAIIRPIYFHSNHNSHNNRNSRNSRNNHIILNSLLLAYRRCLHHHGTHYL